jgi:hypothetical protein
MHYCTSNYHWISLLRFSLPIALTQFSSLSLCTPFFFFPIPLFLLCPLSLLRLLIYHQPVVFFRLIYSFSLKRTFLFYFFPFPSFISLSLSLSQLLIYRQLLIYCQSYAFSSGSSSPHLIISYRPFNCHLLQPIRVIYIWISNRCLCTSVQVAKGGPRIAHLFPSKVSLSFSYFRSSTGLLLFVSKLPLLGC